MKVVREVLHFGAAAIMVSSPGSRMGANNAANEWIERVVGARDPVLNVDQPEVARIKPSASMNQSADNPPRIRV
jgi:hypothetical protein